MEGLNVKRLNVERLKCVSRYMENTTNKGKVKGNSMDIPE